MAKRHSKPNRHFSSRKIKLQQEVDIAYHAKEIAYEDLFASRRDRNKLKRQVEACDSELRALEAQLGIERAHRADQFASIRQLITEKEDEIKKCREEKRTSFQLADSLKAVGDQEAIFARMEGFEQNDRCLILQREIAELRERLDSLRSIDAVLPSQPAYDTLKRRIIMLQEQFEQATTACCALEQEFLAKDAAYGEARYRLAR